MFLLLAGLAFAGPPTPSLDLPASEAPSSWADALDAAGLSRGAGGVVVEVRGEVWALTFAAGGGVRTATVAAPHTEAERERVAIVAASLLRSGPTVRTAALPDPVGGTGAGGAPAGVATASASAGAAPVQAGGPVASGTAAAPAAAPPSAGSAPAAKSPTGAANGAKRPSTTAKRPAGAGSAATTAGGDSAPSSGGVSRAAPPGSTGSATSSAPAASTSAPTAPASTVASPTLSPAASSAVSGSTSRANTAPKPGTGTNQAAKGTGNERPPSPTEVVPAAATSSTWTATTASVDPDSADRVAPGGTIADAAPTPASRGVAPRVPASAPAGNVPLTLSGTLAGTAVYRPDLAVNPGGEASVRVGLGTTWLAVAVNTFEPTTFTGVTGSLGLASGAFHLGGRWAPAEGWAVRAGGGVVAERWAIVDALGEREAWGVGVEAELGVERRLFPGLAVDLGLVGTQDLQDLTIDAAATQPSALSTRASLGLRFGR